MNKKICKEILRRRKATGINTWEISLCQMCRKHKKDCSMRIKQMAR